MDKLPWIVVGTSLRQGADHALAYSVELAAREGARIALVHVYEDLLDPIGALADLVVELRVRLAAAIERSGAARRGVQVEPVLRRGSIWGKLRNVATDLAADRIVVGCRGAASPGEVTRATYVLRRGRWCPSPR